MRRQHFSMVTLGGRDCGVMRLPNLFFPAHKVPLWKGNLIELELIFNDEGNEICKKDLSWPFQHLNQTGQEC